MSSVSRPTPSGSTNANRPNIIRSKPHLPFTEAITRKLAKSRETVPSIASLTKLITTTPTSRPATTKAGMTTPTSKRTLVESRSKNLNNAPVTVTVGPVRTVKPSTSTNRNMNPASSSAKLTSTSRTTPMRHVESTSHTSGAHSTLSSRPSPAAAQLSRRPLLNQTPVKPRPNTVLGSRLGGLTNTTSGTTTTRVGARTTVTNNTSSALKTLEPSVDSSSSGRALTRGAVDAGLGGNRRAALIRKNPGDVTNVVETNKVGGGSTNDSGSRAGSKKLASATSKSVDSLDTQASARLEQLIEDGIAPRPASIKECCCDSTEELCRLETVILEKDRIVHDQDLQLELLKAKLRQRDEVVRNLGEEIQGLRKGFQDAQQVEREEKTKYEERILGMKEEYEESIGELKKEMMDIEQENEARRRERDALESTIAELEHKANLVKTEAAVLTKKLIKAQKDYEEIDTKYRDEAEVLEKLRNEICEKDKDLVEARSQAEELERILEDEKSSLKGEREEWQQFQADMLMVVRVAEEFRAEAATEVEALQQENCELREKIEELESSRNAETKEAGVQANITFARSQLVRSDSQISSAYSDNVEAFNPLAITTTNNNDVHYPLTKYFETISSEIDCNDKENKLDLYTISNVSAEDTILCAVPPEKRILRTASNADSRRNVGDSDKSDPLAALVKINGGSKRNALLKWCQQKTSSYPQVDITNFSTSWCDGMALCALLHNFLPAEIPYDSLKSENREANFKVVVNAADKLGITSNLDINEMIADRPIWEDVMNYVKEIYIRLGSTTQ